MDKSPVRLALPLAENYHVSRRYHDQEVFLLWGLAPDTVVMKVFAPMDKIDRNNIITNQNGTMLAFTVPVKQGPPDWQADYVYFHAIGTDNLWVILGIPMEHRPF